MLLMPMMLKGSEEKTQKQGFCDLSEYFDIFFTDCWCREHDAGSNGKMSAFFETDLSMESNDPIKYLVSVIGLP